MVFCWCVWWLCLVVVVCGVVECLGVCVWVVVSGCGCLWLVECLVRCDWLWLFVCQDCLIEFWVRIACLSCVSGLPA